MDTVLQTFNLSKKFGRKVALNNVNIKVQRGDIYGFIGGNGAGKTTLMRLSLNLAFPTNGKVELFGGEDFSTAGLRVGSLIEAPAFYRGLTAKENLLAFGSIVKANPNKADQLLERVGLADVGKKKAGSFSLGMKQRLGLAIALLGEPELVILDEPVNGLDPTGIRDVRDLILEYNKQKGVTFLISSHLLDELSKIATRYGILNKGNLVEEVSAKELFERTRHRLQVVVDNPVRAAEILSDCTINANGNELVLLTNIDNPAEINARLVKEGIAVSGLTLVSDGLEQYFVERIGE